MQVVPTTPIESPLLAGLNAEQRAAVTAADGPVLIVAGPGSGKTRVLTVRVAHLIQNLGVAPWNVMAVTFTNKAAREMRERMEGLVGERAKWVQLGTFHSFCARTLRQHGERIGIDARFVIYDDGDQMGTVKSTMDSLDISTKHFSPRAVLSVISKSKSQNIGPTAFSNSVESYFEEVVARIYPRYQETLNRRKALDFDDLLSATVRLLHESPETLEALRQRHRYVLVDEYQDTNRIQYLLVKELAAEHRNLCVVGDPDQSIYGWRAADIRNILTFKEDFPEATEIHLEENYRSTPQILGAADAIIRENTQRIDRQLRTSNRAGEKIILKELFDEAQEAQFVVSELMRLKDQQGCSGSDIAVLYRTNWQSRAIEEAFIRAAIPYQLIGGTRFYERKEIKDALSLLRLISNPDDTSAFERVVSEFPIGTGIGAKSIGDIENWSRTNGSGISAALESLGAPGGPTLASRAQKLFQSFHTQLEQLREIEPSLPLSEFFDRALEDTGYTGFFESGDPELMERWENLQQFRSNLERFDDEPSETRLTTFLSEVALVSDADTIDHATEKVTLITLHAVKGLEFAVVFLTGVEEGLIPHQRSIQDNPAMLEEERRLFYVGITRAKQRLYLTHAFRRSRFGGSEPSVPSQFLISIPPNLVESGGGSGKSSGTRSRSSGRERPVVRKLIEPEPQVQPVFAKVERGQRVFHTKFGDGLVISAVERGDDQEVTVDFKRHGQKRLMASLANLTTGE